MGLVAGLAGLPQVVLGAQIAPPPAARLLLAPDHQRLQAELFSDQPAEGLDDKQTSLTIKDQHRLAWCLELGDSLLPRTAAAHIVGLLIQDHLAIGLHPTGETPPRIGLEPPIWIHPSGQTRTPRQLVDGDGWRLIAAGTARVGALSVVVLLEER
jgi:hypothetical protein